MHRCKTTWMWNCSAFWVQLVHWWYECRLSHLNELRELENDMKTTLVRARHSGKEHWLMTYWWFIWGSQTRRRHWSNLVHFFRWSWLGAGIDSSPYSPQNRRAILWFWKKKSWCREWEVVIFWIGSCPAYWIKFKWEMVGQDKKDKKKKDKTLGCNACNYLLENWLDVSRIPS